jgi:hypothetical protein
MDVTYSLRPTATGHRLSRGKLESALDYPGPDAIEYGRRLVGFLSQVSGAQLYVFDKTGNIVETKTYRAGLPPPANSLVTMLSGTENTQTGVST